jgi:hypothetical protein
VAMGDIFDDFVVDMLPTSPRLRRTSCELHRSLSSTRRAHPPTYSGIYGCWLWQGVGIRIQVSRIR